MPEFAWMSVTSLGAFMWEFLVGPPHEIRRFVSATASPALIRLWPSSIAPVTWPPATPLTGDLLAQMRTAIQSKAKPGVPEPFQRTWSRSR
ncbi:MAG TPA: hypothetical protein VF230_17155 [Acidimicrobiales bacterium]